MNARLASLLGGALLVAVVTAACGSSYSSPMSPSPTPPANAATVTIRIVAIAGAQSFTPDPASVPVGRTVAFYNADGYAHRIVADGGAFDTGNLNPGATSTPIMMSTAGALGYHDTIYPTMVGTLNIASQ